MSSLAMALPGKEIPSSTSNLHAGPGTYTSEDGRILPTLTGPPKTIRLSNSTGNATAGLPAKASLQTVESHMTSNQKTLLLPDVGDSIYARVLRMTQKEVIFSIVVIDRNPSLPSSSSSSQGQQPDSDMFPLPHPFRGVLRSVDVRATQKDTVVLSESFRVGDIVRARVISLGDQGGYYLSTAGNEFGVVLAWSDAGYGCVPISWREVQDEVTGVVEGRKVAKPI